MGSKGEMRGQDVQVLVDYSKQFVLYSKGRKEAFEGLNLGGNDSEQTSFPWLRPPYSDHSTLQISPSFK